LSNIIFWSITLLLAQLMAETKINLHFEYFINLGIPIIECNLIQLLLIIIDTFINNTFSYKLVSFNYSI